MPRSVFDIFLSSTSNDLATCRAKVSEVIERMGQAAIRMETFGAKPDKPLAACREEVRGCDALIVIVGHRYGWIPGQREGGDGRRSITFWEVLWAIEKGIPVYTFLLDPSAPWSGEREQDRLIGSRSSKAFIEVGEAVRQLQKLRAFLEKRTTRDTFRSAEDLGGKVATSLHDWLLRQAVERTRSDYQGQGGLMQLPRGRRAAQSRLPGPETLYWQEQIHLLSAQRMAGGMEGFKIALVAGKADVEHPALRGASVKQLEVHKRTGASRPDDYTTAMASLLVGGGEGTTCHGVAPGCSLLILGALDKNRRTTDAVILGAVNAALVEGARVICLPLSSDVSSPETATAFREAARSGAVIICGAGNSAQDQPVFPGAYPECIAIAAVDRNNRVAGFSNFGEWVAAAAPGVDLPVAVRNGRYEDWSGTSMACGIAAGIAALMLKTRPRLTGPKVKEVFRSTGPRALQAAGDGFAAHSLHVLDALAAIQSVAS